MLTLDFGPYRYNLHRKTDINAIDAFTVSKDPLNKELVIHVNNSYDDRMNCLEHKNNIWKVLVQLKMANKSDFLQYNVPQKKLRAFATTKNQAKNGKYIRPPAATSKDVTDEIG